MSNIDRFGIVAIETAMRSAAEYIRVHKLSVDLNDVIESMRQIIRERLKANAWPDHLNPFSAPSTSAAAVSS